MRPCSGLFVLTLALFATSPDPAEAGRRGGGALFTTGQDLLPVAQTQVTGPGGAAMTLCHLVDRATVFFVPAYTAMDAYAFSTDGCEGEGYYTITQTQFVSDQAAGLIPADIPVEPTLSVLQLVWGHAAWLVGGLLILIAWLRKRAAGRRTESVAMHSVIAMANVAAADGHVDQNETHGMAHILSRIQGRTITPERVSQMIDQMQPSAEDFDKVGQGLARKDRHLVLQAALTIAVADGEMHPEEYDLVSRLAKQMKIGAKDFRTALKRVSGLLRQPMPGAAAGG